ncbi:hypothetical protein FRB96_007222 [Tulasnella sp. 330]|nr:hypothetical protein FRB96_007222 [Tulasnella sp. 330]
MLQDLSLVDTGEFQGTKDPFGEQTLQLRQIKLSRSFLVPWNSKILSGLRILELSKLGMGGPSADQVDSILRASLTLIELTLQDFSPKENNASPKNWTRPVELLSLRRFTMDHLSPELTTHLLDKVRIPDCKSIIIRTDASIKASCFPSDGLLCSAQAITEACDLVKVELGATLFGFECWKQSKVVLRVCIDGQGWELSTAESHLRQLDASLDLDVVIDTNLFEKSDLTKILNLFPSLRRALALRLSYYRLSTHDASNALIGGLGVAAGVDGVLRWPLPRLETLKVKSSWLEAEALLGVIRARLEAKTEPLSKLKCLQLAKNLQGYFTRFESTLGEGVVSCYRPGSGSYELLGGSESGSEPEVTVVRRRIPDDTDSGHEDEGEDEGQLRRIFKARFNRVLDIEAEVDDDDKEYENEGEGDQIGLRRTSTIDDRDENGAEGQEDDDG